MGEKKYSTFLFPEPSGLYGVGSLFDIGAQLHSYNASATTEIADMWAAHCDWSAVGHDLRKALEAELAEYLRKHAA